VTRRTRDQHHRSRASLRGFGYFRRLGPGFVTGAADDDPAGIGTYSQVGATFRFDLVWTALVSLPLAIAVQEACARLGLTTGRGLMALIKERFPIGITWTAAALVVAANAFNIGADLGAMAQALQLLVPIPFVPLVVAIAIAILLLEIFVSYDRYALVLRFLALSIVAYVVELFIVHVDWGAVLAGFVPTFRIDVGSLEALVAIFGTTISPYLFVWQAGEEMEEVRSKNLERVSAKQLRAMRADVVSGMSAGIVVMFAILVTAGSTLHGRGPSEIQTAAQAAEALEPVAGRFASALFAAGILGTGLLAIPTLAGSGGYAVSEAFGWREGLGRSLRQAPGFYAVIAAAILIGLVLDFLGIDPIRALIVSAILNGLAAPPLILLIILLARAPNRRHRTGALSAALMWAAFGLMTVCGVVYLATLFL
jgi:NRAMP (natural resistance-associated macrophage protein)-like metal ion transporter